MCLASPSGATIAPMVADQRPNAETVAPTGSTDSSRMSAETSGASSKVSAKSRRVPVRESSPTRWKIVSIVPSIPNSTVSQPVART